MPCLEIAFTAGTGIIVHLDAALAEHVMGAFHPGEHILRKGNELIHRPHHQSAIDMSVIVKCRALKGCIKTIKAAHIAMHGIGNVSSRRKIMDFVFKRFHGFLILSNKTGFVAGFIAANGARTS